VAAEGNPRIGAVDRRAGLLFVGGNSPGDLNVRQAQAVLRMDRLASAWSHVALVLHWPDGAAAHEIIGVEVALDPAPGERQVPERNGVTFFTLDRYLDAARYPNLAFVAILSDKVSGPKRGRGTTRTASGISAGDKDQLESAALNPMREPGRYPLWDWLGVWSRFAYTGRENPLLESISHPAAAFCEYAFEVMRIDLTPGATAPNTAPETIWNTLHYWYQTFRGDGRNLELWTSLTGRDVASRPTLSLTLKDDFEKRRSR
jgi:hypothetical protein